MAPKTLLLAAMVGATIAAPAPALDDNLSASHPQLKLTPAELSRESAEMMSKSKALFANKPPAHLVTIPANPSTLVTVVSSADKLPPSEHQHSRKHITFPPVTYGPTPPSVSLLTAVTTHPGGFVQHPAWSPHPDPIGAYWSIRSEIDAIVGGPILEHAVPGYGGNLHLPTTLAPEQTAALWSYADAMTSVLAMSTFPIVPSVDTATKFFDRPTTYSTPESLLSILTTSPVSAILPGWDTSTFSTTVSSSTDPESADSSITTSSEAGWWTSANSFPSVSSSTDPASAVSSITTSSEAGWWTPANAFTEAPITAAASLADRHRGRRQESTDSVVEEEERPFHQEELVGPGDGMLHTEDFKTIDGEVVAFWQPGQQAPYIPINPTPLQRGQRSSLVKIASKLAEIGGYTSVPKISEITWDYNTMKQSQANSLYYLLEELDAVNLDISTRPVKTIAYPWVPMLGPTIERTTYLEHQTHSEHGAGAYLVEVVGYAEHNQAQSDHFFGMQTLTLPNIVYVNRPTESGRFSNAWIPESKLAEYAHLPATEVASDVRAAPTGAVSQGENGQVHGSPSFPAKAGSTVERIAIQTTLPSVAPTATPTAGPSGIIEGVPIHWPDHLIAHPHGHDCAVHIPGAVGVICNDEEAKPKPEPAAPSVPAQVVSVVQTVTSFVAPVPTVTVVHTSTPPVSVVHVTETPSTADWLVVSGGYVWQGPEGQLHGPSKPLSEVPNTSFWREA